MKKFFLILPLFVLGFALPVSAAPVQGDCEEGEVLDENDACVSAEEQNEGSPVAMIGTSTGVRGTTGSTTGSTMGSTGTATEATGGGGDSSG